MSSSSLVDVVCRHLDAAGVARGPDGAQLMLPDAVAARLRDQRRPQGVRHGLASLVSVLVAGVACGHRSPLAIAQAAAGWGQEVLAGHGCRIKLAKAGGKKKVHLLGAVTHVTGLVIGQDKVAKSGKANEVTHFKPLPEPLPLRGAVVTADAMQATRGNARYVREVKHAHFLWPVPGNQPAMYAALDALDRENTSVAAAASEITRGRVETRTIRVLPVPGGLADFPYAEQAILIERYVTVRKNGRWVMRNCEAVLYVTSLAAEASTPRDLLAHVRGHWTVEHLHWLRDVILKEDKSLIRTGNRPQVMSAIVNLVTTLFRIRGVTGYAEETRRNAQDPRRALQMLDLLAPSPG